MSKSEESVALRFYVERNLITVLRARPQGRQDEQLVDVSGETLDVEVIPVHTDSPYDM
jgi:hypothetical protein